MKLPTSDLEAMIVAELVARYANDRHIPERSCLGCGGSTRDPELQALGWSSDTCDTRGASMSLWKRDDPADATTLHLVSRVTLTWRQLAAAARWGSGRVVQENLGI